MTTSTTSITPDLIRYLANAGTSPIPSPVLVKAKHHLLDTIAADRKSTRLNSSHIQKSRMPSSA